MSWWGVHETGPDGTVYAAASHTAEMGPSHVGTLSTATWNRRPVTAKSVLQRGRIVGFEPEPPVHAVDSTVAEADRATICGLDAGRMYLWNKSFEDTLPDDRCLDCEETLRPRADGRHGD